MWWVRLCVWQGRVCVCMAGACVWRERVCVCSGYRVETEEAGRNRQGEERGQRRDRERKWEVE